MRESFLGETFHGGGDDTMGSSQGTVVGLSTPEPWRRLYRESGSGENVPPEAVLKTSPQESHVGPRPAAGGVAGPRQPSSPARPPLGGLSPAYLTEDDPRPELPGSRARGSPSRRGRYTSMAAGGGEGLCSCEGRR